MPPFFARALELLNQGDGDQAIALLREGVDDEATPETLRGEAAGLLAELLAEQGQMAAAEPLFRQALLTDAGHIGWQRGYLACLASLGEAVAARQVATALLAQRPDDASAHRHLALLSAAAGEMEAARTHAREVLFLAPFDLAALAAMADVLILADEPLMAVEALVTALRRAHPADPMLPVAAIAQARAWMALAEPRKAETALRRALEADPADEAGAAALLAQLNENGGNAHLPAAFVRALFDTYADRFDRDLVGKLNYNAPAALRRMLDIQGIPSGLAIIDAGCGTGLAGVALKDMAASLAGFDLSPRMVEKARQRGIYDALWVGDFCGSLLERPAACDLLVAADVLVYLGDLHPVMGAAALCLRPGGRFAFTCEQAEGDGFHLHEGRRFAHAPSHILAAAQAAGLRPQAMGPHSSRTEKGQPVPGLLCLLERPL